MPNVVVCMRFTLPVKKKHMEMVENMAGQKKMQEMENKDLPHDAVKEHILAADDDAGCCEWIKGILEPSYQVSCVASGRKVLEFLQKETPSLILLDLFMPDLGGLDVLLGIKAHKKWKEIPVIMMTAEIDSELESKGFEGGALDFITKPLDATILMQRIRRNLKIDRIQKKLQAELREQTKIAQKRRMQVERLSLQIMEALANAIDAKDKYTNGHSMRVAGYSKELARRLGMSQKELKDFYYMGLLHDIGKIGIPDDIISKKSELSEWEYYVMKSHPQIGEEILKHISEIPGIETGARWHHEKYDGTGYFRGLKGEQIPLGGRILAVSDVFDAITSVRHYRDRMPMKDALGIIFNGSGKHFDAKIVDVFFNIHCDIIMDVLITEYEMTLKDKDRKILKSYNLKQFYEILNKDTVNPKEQNLIDIFDSYYLRNKETAAVYE